MPERHPAGNRRAPAAKGAKVDARNKDGDTALIRFAAYQGEVDRLRQLLDWGADINARNNKGVTALTNAISGGRVENVDLLLERGADVNAADDRGEGPVIAACRKGDLSLFKTLISRGANPRVKGPDGTTLLMMVAGARMA